MTGGPRTVVVTGGSSGIGAAVVDWFLAAEPLAELVVVDLRRPERASCRYVEADLTRPTEVTQALGSFDGLVDVLVNNAGGGYPCDDPRWPDPATWSRFLDLNLSGAYHVTATLREHLAEGAHVCNVSSIAGLGPWPAFPAYGAAKAALMQLTRSWAATLAPRQVKVNAVAPGYVYTASWSDLTDEEAFEAMAADRTLLGRAQTTREVAELVGFLCSSANQSITGQVVAVDGGASLGPAYHHRAP